MLKKKQILLSIFILFVLSIGIVSAADNVTVCCHSDDNQLKITEDLENTNSTSVEDIKIPVKIETDTNETYVNSDIYFQAIVYDNNTNIPLNNVKVLFKVYSDETHYQNYSSTTNKQGIASLNKNLPVGNYTIYACVDNPEFEFDEIKSTYQVKPTAEWGCCSFYLQISETESIGGFRRDATNAADIYIRTVEWYGRNAIKQYKLADGYFFHIIITSDGWMIGTGGMDSPSINKAIENLAGKMVKSNKIINSYLKKIKYYKSIWGMGHFSIKAPDGRYAVVWEDGYWTGKLKPGEYISIPNYQSYYRHGKYNTFDKTPLKAAVKVGATDKYGINRRDITVFHWKAVTKNYQTSSYVKTYAANDAGNYVGRSTAYLKDNIRYKGKFISKDSLPNAPKLKILGAFNFGNIDKLIKTQTTVKAPIVINPLKQTKYFKVTVTNKITKKPVKYIKIKIKISKGNFLKTYKIKTNKWGIALINTKSFDVGKYYVTISTANNYYIVYSKSKIIIRWMCCLILKK